MLATMVRIQLGLPDSEEYYLTDPAFGNASVVLNAAIPNGTRLQLVLTADQPSILDSLGPDLEEADSSDFKHLKKLAATSSLGHSSFDGPMDSGMGTFETEDREHEPASNGGGWGAWAAGGMGLSGLLGGGGGGAAAAAAASPADEIVQDEIDWNEENGDMV